MYGTTCGIVSLPYLLPVTRGQPFAQDDDDDDVTVDNSGGEDLQKLSADQRALMNAEMDHVLHPDFVKRFVLYVRRHRYNHNYDRMKISEAAAAKIREIWVTLRSGDQNG